MDSSLPNITGNLVGSRSVECDALAREIMQHRDEDKNRSYLGKAIVDITEAFTGNNKSLEHMDTLMQKATLAQMTGNSAEAAAVQKEMQDAVLQDVAARKSADSWSSHAGNFIKSVGLFFPGKGGYAVSALTNAADSAHPNDSGLRQGADLLLGAGKGAALKWSFDRVGQTEWNLALKAGALSLSNRLAETGLDSHTYFDKKTGEFAPAAGLWNTAKSVADLNQLGSDAVAFGGGYLLLNRFGVTPQLAKEAPMLAQSLTGAGFGFSSGFFSDLQMQKKSGQGIDLGSALKSGLLQMTLDGTAAAIGGARIQQLQTRAVRASEAPRAVAPAELKPDGLDMKHVQGIYGLDPRPVARPKTGVESGSASDGGIHLTQTASGANDNLLLNSPEVAPMNASGTLHIAKVSAGAGTLGLDLDSVANRVSEKVAGPQSAAGDAISGGVSSDQNRGARDFVTRENVSSLLPELRAQGLDAQALLKVREVLGGSDASPKLGPEQTMLIRHLAPGLKVPAEMVGNADLIATCSPELLRSLGLADQIPKHVFPEAGSSPVMLQVPGSNHLRFSLPDALKSSALADEPALKLGGGSKLDEPNARESGQTISQWLRGLDIKDRMSDLHDVSLIAKAMDQYKAPIKRFLGGGNETIAFEMKDGKVLRVTEKPFRPEWGTRTIEVNGKEYQFDTSIIGKRMQVRIGDKVVNYYEQPKGITPVSEADAKLFEDLIDRDGKYIFWDNDPIEWAQSQLAYVPLVKLPNGLLSAIPVRSRAGMPSHRGLGLIDYDAVRIPGTEPKQGQPRGSWDFGSPSDLRERYEFFSRDQR